MTSLKGKIVFITGATSGIGLACARQFAQQGARLLIAARREERLQELSTELSSTGTDALWLMLDVRNQSAVQTAVDGLPEEWQEIEVLVNNAGLSRGLPRSSGSWSSGWSRRAGPSSRACATTCARTNARRRPR